MGSILGSPYFGKLPLGIMAKMEIAYILGLYMYMIYDLQITRARDEEAVEAVLCSILVDDILAYVALSNDCMDRKNR